MITFHLTNDEGVELDVTARPRDILQWEKTTKGAKFSDFEKGIELSTLYSVAFMAARRQGLVEDKNLAEFEANWDCLPTGEDETDPTPEAA